MHAMRDPNSSLAKQLLNTISSVDEKDSRPWWEAFAEDYGGIPDPYIPPPLQVPSSLIEQVRTALQGGQGTLLFNILAVWWGT